MGLLQRIIGTQPKKDQPQEGKVRARYDVAQTTGENAKHWAQADDLSADTANSPSVRRILRNRARYEVANNSYAKGIVKFIAGDVIGSTIRVQMRGIDQSIKYGKKPISKETATIIEGEFHDWMEANGIIPMLRTVRTARTVDGEAFLVEGSNPKSECPVQLSYHAFEADLFTSTNYLFNANSVDGIVFDSYGNPVSYTMQIGGTFDGLTQIGGNELSIPASKVIHLFTQDRPQQHRGIPEITPSLSLFAQLRRFTLAVIGAAETAADFAGIMKTASGPDEAMEGDPFARIELERRALLTLPDGWEIQQLKAEHPTTTYADFKQEIIGEIAKCLEVPLNVAKGDSSKHNYASAKLDWQLWYKYRTIDRKTIQQQVLNRFFARWFAEARLIPNYLPADAVDSLADTSHVWLFDGDQHQDPLKEANAQATRIASNTTTLADEWGRQGEDWEEKLVQIAREKAKLQALGLAAAAPAPEQQDPEDIDDPEDGAQASLQFVRDANGHLTSIVGF